MAESASESRAVRPDELVPRVAITLLLSTHLCMMAALGWLLTPWLLALSAICALWGVAITSRRTQHPGRIAKTVFVLAVVGTVVWVAPTPLSLDTAARLLAVTFALKLIEIRRQADARVAVLLGYFVIATGFLFEQSLPFTLFQLLMLAGLTATLVALQPTPAVEPIGSSVRTSLSLIAQALPLTLVVFILFPRVAPLWSVPVPGLHATGLREQMTPGDVAELGRSDALAFRAAFPDDVPEQRDRYWRALVYNDFRAGTWSVVPEAQATAEDGKDRDGNESGTAPDERPDDSGRATDYEIWLEPHGSTWLVALEHPQARSSSQGAANAWVTNNHATRGTEYQWLTDNGLLRSAEPVLSVLRYRVQSRVGDRRAAFALSDATRRASLSLPEHESPRLRAFAARIWRDFPSPDAFVERVLLNISAERFHYTLNPPLLPREHSIDAFWFETQRGFCSHYAGALVFMLRSVGIPAQLVGGFQGGELNPLTRHIVVRDYDAHAWVEYWQPERGWTRVDPTAAVAPERIERGPQVALSAADRATISGLAGARLAGMNTLALWINWIDSIDHHWNMWVIGYDTRTQADLLDRLLGAATPARIALALALAGVIAVLAVVAIPRLLRVRTLARPRRAPGVHLYLCFANRAYRFGAQPLRGETPAAHLRRIAQDVNLDEQTTNVAIATLQSVLYAPAPEARPSEIDALRRALRGIVVRLFVRRLKRSAD